MAQGIRHGAHGHEGSHTTQARHFCEGAHYVACKFERVSLLDYSTDG